MNVDDLYPSPLGMLHLMSDGTALTHLLFEDPTDNGCFPPMSRLQPHLPIFSQTRIWLDRYFRGECPGVLPPLRLHGTPFQCRVWQLLQAIPYGSTVSYGELARQLAAERNMKTISAQAVGQAVGRNPVAIIVPCHRVVGAHGSLTGYAGGLERKQWLLQREGLCL